MVQTDRASKLAQALSSGRLAVIADCVATVADADSLKQLARALPPSLDAVVMRDDVTLSTVACSSLLAAERLEPVLALSTAQRNRVALMADARGAALVGVKNLLCVAGEHPSKSASPEAAGTFDVDPTQLIQMLKADDVTRSMLIGSEVYPKVRPLELALIDTRKKVAAGAEFLVTQPIDDLAAFEEWMTAVRGEGIAEKVAIIASVRADDAAEEGVAACAELVSKLKGVEGVRGIYIRGSGKPETAGEIIRRAGLAG
jgi:5,10-methylenetetrahydrofolate reductase